MIKVDYASEKSCGVAAKKFYHNVGCTMSAVSQGTGISRSALSRIVIHKATKQTAGIALEFLENEIQAKYLEHVDALQKEYVEHTRELQKKAEIEWLQYLARDNVLENCRVGYGLERKNPRIDKVEIRQAILSEKKSQ